MFLRKAFCRIDSSLPGTSGDTLDKGAGSAVRMAAMQSLGVAPRNGGLPAIIS
jgi:hypothetical protein